VSHATRVDVEDPKSGHNLGKCTVVSLVKEKEDMDRTRPQQSLERLNKVRGLEIWLDESHISPQEKID
jgi:hypothetical protein